MRYRGRLDIINRILEVCSENGGEKKSIIMGRVGLNSSQTKTYLPFMLSKSFLGIESDGNGEVRYAILKKGYQYKKRYDELVRIVN